MNVEYLYQGAADDFVDELGPGTASLLCLDQAGIGRVAFREASGYRTMASSVAFGALYGPYRDLLLAKYVHFLLHGSGVEEPQQRPAGAAFRPIQSPARAGQPVGFAIARGSGGTLTLFDAAGRSVAPTGIPAGAARVEVGAGLAPGVYVALLGGSTPAARTFTVVR